MLKEKSPLYIELEVGLGKSNLIISNILFMAKLKILIYKVFSLLWLIASLYIVPLLSYETTVTIHAEVVIIQQLPHVVPTTLLFEIPNLRHKISTMPKIRHYYNI